MDNIKPPYELTEYSEHNLYSALSNPHCSPDQVAKRRIARYLFGYLQDVGAKSIFVEHGYTDGDFLDDFASYYVRCFRNYDRRCKRVHFFRSVLSEQSFQNFLLKTANPAEEEAFRDDYLGFVVARPLPDAIIGRTLLRTYADDNGRRNYTCVRTYKPNLFGIELPVSTLPFQEQDTVLAACATVSLWSALHMTADLFGTPAPRPAAITQSATLHIHHARPIPSHGLVIQQLCNAIRRVDLEPEVIPVKPATPLVSLIYAHLCMKLPVILGVRIEGRGRHAITVAGYSLKSDQQLMQEVAPGLKCIPMVGLRIDELYAHDDQIGPFCRIKVSPSTAGQNAIYPVTFEGSWIEPSTGKLLRLYPESVIIPVYNKIRVTFQDMLGWLTKMHRLLSVVIIPGAKIEWDVHLSSLHDNRSRIRGSAALSPATRKELLLEQHPRFIWRSIVRVNDVESLELLADATDMARSLPFFAAIWHRDDFRLKFREILESPLMRDTVTTVLTDPFRKFLDDHSAN